MVKLLLIQLLPRNPILKALRKSRLQGREIQPYWKLIKQKSKKKKEKSHKKKDKHNREKGRKKLVRERNLKSQWLQRTRMKHKRRV
jgi:hypothetical protein